MDSLINASDIKIADLLRSGLFKVPRHQRYYDWDKRQVDDLLNDLYDSAVQNKSCYFLGSIMLIKNGKQNEFEINDGQQRMITFSMICAYFCRSFKEQNDSDGESDTLRVLFDIPKGHGKTLEDTESTSPRIMPPQNDKANFNRLIRGDDIGRSGKMTLAWNQIISFFAEKPNFDIKQQKEILKFMLNKIVVIRLEVDNSLDVNAIYETLNSRGKNLSDIDSIKNYFLSFFANDETVNRYDVCEKFEKIGTAIPATHISDYVRCCMQAEYGFIHKEQLFHKTKSIFSGSKAEKSREIFKLTDSLSASGNLQIFKMLLRKPESSDFLDSLTKDAKKSNNRRKIDSYLLDLHDYKITRPIVLTLLFCYFNESTRTKKQKASFVYGCCKILASFVQRISHVSSSFKPSVYEEHFAGLAKGINKGKCNTVEMFFDRIKHIDNLGLIDDSRYINLMESKFYGKNSLKKSRYILRNIVGWQEKNPVIVAEKISVEHVLPKSAQHYTKKGWAEKFDQADCDRLLYCLGNLTLLSNDSSTAKDNASFSAKKRLYSDSSFKLTRDICNYDEWIPETIEKRQHELIKIAAKQIWNFH